MSNELEIILYLEWEALNKPIHITKVEDNENLPNGKKKITIERDEDYNLKSTLEFEDVTFKRKQIIAGSISEGFQIHGSSKSGRVSYILDSSHVGSFNINHNIEENKVTGIASLRFNTVKITNSDNSVAHLSEWYVNGPSDHVFSRLTDRKVNRHYTRKRFFSKENNVTDIDVSLESSSSKTDVIWITTNDFQFLVGEVPKKIEPIWSNNIGIEYRADWGRIPEPDERVKIQELISFVFGKQLLSVGYTTYDKDENPIDAFAHNPWGSSGKSFCSRPEYPPISIHNFSNDAEKIITQLLPKYFELSEPLYLSEALWNYWISCDVPVGTNLPILVAAIETIINQWYKWKQSKSHGVYMETKVYADMLKDDIESIEKKLSGNSYSKQMLDNILRANEFGIMERYRRFFEELNLTISHIEWEAIKERHLFVHGHAHFSELDWIKVIQHVNTLQTLFNRVLLRLLEYKGTYIDRSSLGWPDKTLE